MELLRKSVGHAAQNKHQAEAVAAHHPHLVPRQVAIEDAQQGDRRGQEPAAGLKELLDPNRRRLEMKADPGGHRRRDGDRRDIDPADPAVPYGPRPPHGVGELQWPTAQGDRAERAVDKQQPFEWLDMLPFRIGRHEHEALVDENHQQDASRHKGEEGPFAVVHIPCASGNSSALPFSGG